MKTRCLIGILSLSAFFSPISVQSSTPSDIVVDEQFGMEIVVPEYPLAAWSLKVRPLSNLQALSQWSEDNHLGAFYNIQKIIQIWEKRGVSDYLIYGKESPTSIFSWEIVPFQKEGSRFWKQFNVLWNMTFGSSSLSTIEQEKIAEEFQKEMELYSSSTSHPPEFSKTEVGDDPFCNPAVIDKQLVFAGKEINILYNYAPIVLGQEKLHFLIVPKNHHSKFSELTASEYLESIQLSQQLIEHYKEKGYHTAYLFDKSGVEAGQTVPHWHEHLIFTATKTEEYWGKLIVLKNMLIGSSPLPETELAARVLSLKAELSFLGT